MMEIVVGVFALLGGLVLGRIATGPFVDDDNGD